MERKNVVIALILILLCACQKPDPSQPFVDPPVVDPPVTSPPPLAETFIVSTVAGNGIGDYMIGGSTISPINSPVDVAVDAGGTLYVAEYNRIRKVTSSGEISTLAGNGEIGYVDSIGPVSEFGVVGGLDIDSKGNIYVADGANFCVRKITPTGFVSTFAGSRARAAGYVDGTSINARFSRLYDLAIDLLDNIYVSEGERIRKITPEGIVSTLAGTGISGYKEGPGNVAQFYHLGGIAVDKQGNVYAADETNNRIRKISTTGFVSTLAGSGFNGYLNGKGAAVLFASPQGVAVDSKGTVYVNDFSNMLVRKIAPDGTVTNCAGMLDQSAFADGPGSTAKFRAMQFLSIDKQDNVYIADRGNHRIRKITKM